MALALNPWAISRVLAGATGEETEVEFASGDRKLRVLVPSDELWGSVKDILVFEEYEILPPFALNRLEGGVVVDAGANAGLYSLKVSPFAKKVVAFEPASRNLRRLAGNVERNDIRNVEIRQNAIWPSSGEVEFSDRNVGFVSQLEGATGDYLVRTALLDDIVEELGTISCLKMDIEGAEYDVLMSCSDSTLRQVERIAVEFHIYRQEHPQKLASVIQRFSNAGFRVKTLKIPYQSPLYGLTKPWRNSLLTCNGRRASLYKGFLSVVYGSTPVVRVLKGSIDIGTQSLLFAYRPS